MTKGMHGLVKQTSRRSFLMGAGGFAVGLPFLATLAAPRRANAWEPLANGPRRLIVMRHAHGLVMEEWLPNNNGSYRQILQPIADAGLQNKTLVVAGVDHKITSDHWGNNWSSLTCVREHHWGSANWQIQGATASVDHVIGRLINNGLAPRRLDLRVPDDPGQDVTTSNVFWAGNGDPINQQNRPLSVYERLFGQPDDGATVDLLMVRRKSVLDHVLQDFNRLRSRISTEDRPRLDAHAEKIRTLEQALGGGGNQGPRPASCSTDPTLVSVQTYDYRRYAEAHADLLVHAVACGQADVGTLMFGEPGASAFAFLNEPTIGALWGRAEGSYHGAWHLYSDAGERGDTARAWTVVNRWMASVFARAMQGLSQIDEGNGRSALDNTMLLWCGEYGNGGGHAAGNQTITIGGNFGNVAMGRYLDLCPETAPPIASWGNRDRPGLHQLCVSMLNAFNSPVNEFGNYDDVNENVVRGPLPGLA